MNTKEILQGIKDWAAPKVIYDISAAHNNTKYTDLSDALGTNGSNIPQEYKKGGITVRYVQSSDNKYVQYRYMSSSTAVADFTDTDNWQGIDSEPVDNSNNLVKSGGVSAFGKRIERNISYVKSTIYFPPLYLINKEQIYIDGTTASSQYLYSSGYLFVSKGSLITIKGVTTSDNIALLTIYKLDKSTRIGYIAGGSSVSETKQDSVLANEDCFIRFCSRIDYSQNFECIVLAKRDTESNNVTFDYKYTSLYPIATTDNIVLANSETAHSTNRIFLSKGSVINYKLKVNNALRYVLALYNEWDSWEAFYGILGDVEGKEVSGAYTVSNDCWAIFSNNINYEPYILITPKSQEEYLEKIEDNQEELIGASNDFVPLVAEWELGTLLNGDGSEDPNNGRMRSDFIPCIKGDKYKFENAMIKVFAYDGSKGFLNVSNTSFEVKTSYECLHDGYIRIVTSYDSASTITENGMIRLKAQVLKNQIVPSIKDDERKVFDTSVQSFAYNLTRENGVKIGFITDIHYFSQNHRIGYDSGNDLNMYLHSIDHARNIVGVSNKTKMDLIINGGDLSWDQLPPSDTFKLMSDLNAVLQSGKTPVRTCAGNHDFNDDYYASSGTSDSDYFTNKDFSNIVNQKETWGYYDIENVRCIFLNTSDSLVISSGEKVYSRKTVHAISAKQVSWLIDILENTPNGKHIIVFSHNSLRNTINGEYIITLFNKFISGLSGTISSSYENFTFSYNYNFTSKSNNYLIGFVNGHTHTDALETNGDNTFISTTTSSMYEEGSLTRTYNTITEDAWDVFCIDTENKNVNVKRFGAGTDRTFSYL